jgi:DNA-3-methyladenine glycosylase
MTAYPARHPPARAGFTRLSRSFYRRDARIVARDLLGRFLAHRVEGALRVGMIVETEAYLGPHDAAAHSRHGPTRRNAPMFGPAGHAYVYMIYGIHECMNVVAGREGAGSAVLLRALEPVQNCDGKTSGPGLLTKAMGITRSLSGHDLVSDDLFLMRGKRSAGRTIAVTKRIGVEYAGRWADRHLRFYIRGNPFVSRR